MPCRQAGESLHDEFARSEGTAVPQPELYKMMATLELMKETLDRMERAQSFSVIKEAYTTTDVAERLQRAEWTVRQWCNKRQVQGAFKVHGKGRTGEWRIPHDALIRLQETGPLPLSIPSPNLSGISASQSRLSM